MSINHNKFEELGNALSDTFLKAIDIKDLNLADKTKSAPNETGVFTIENMGHHHLHFSGKFFHDRTDVTEGYEFNLNINPIDYILS